jgi:ferrochelatase
MDKYVIDVPFLQSTCSWNHFTNKTKKSAAAYAKIWWDEGSPLVVISEERKSKTTC